ncbi:hypothetical protein CBP36_21065 (plasmid) [Acidovorax carolinensis]|uniref:Uncharacterized protein n=2 Tax=Acidovorax carolinensis TaxID=553814 RepID=A0A240UIZ2_9BURK|nr:hypothetical protein CBP36_21065 [Acidovorax carolinensis]
MSCANVVLALQENEQAVLEAVEELKQQHGRMWSWTTAVQLLSGRRGEFASDCAPPEAQERLLWCRMVAKMLAESRRMATVNPPSQEDFCRVRALVNEMQQVALPASDNASDV